MQTSQFSPRLLRLLVVVTATVLSMALLGGRPLLAQYNNTIFGPNVYVLNPGIGTTALNNQLNALNQEAQFSTNRHAILFQPGTYTLSAEVGYYESIAGLGETPGAVVLNGGGVYSDQLVGGNLTQNFWRSVENYTVNPPNDPNSNPVTNTNRWGVSQGAAFRRIHVAGDLEVTNQSCNFASGGFISDSIIDKTLAFCSQQQWYTRNSTIGNATGDVWNYVFSGVQGNLTQSFPVPPYTVLGTTPASREKPFLYVDASGNYNVFSPALKTNSNGPSWTGTDPGPGTTLPISSFFIAQPTTPVAQINSALATPGMNLILTPGIYQLASPIQVKNANTVVLGMGYATLVPTGGNASMTVADVDGVQIAGLIFDAGPTQSPVLLQVGVAGGARVSHATNPTSLNDVFVRIGGASAGSAVTSIEVDSDNVILDNIWAWRADHGNGVGWTVNTAAHGVVVNGDNVTALGLAVEHYQQEQTLWNGNGGETIFYQSELPYDPPNQAAWKDGSANGYPSYVVSNAVSSHTGWGLGVYSFFNLGQPIVDDNAITVPNAAGVVMHDMSTVFLSTSGGSGQITHVIDNTGNISNASNADVPQTVTTYGGVACTSNCPPAAPASPTNLTATTASSTQINLSWTASTTAGASYVVFRSTTAGFAASASTQIGTTAAGTTTFADTGLTGNTTYYYLVKATNAAGTSLASNQATATTNTTQPAPPTNLVATAVSSTQINLSWTASTTAGVYYEVFGSTTAGFTPSEGSLLASTSGTTYSNTGLTAGTTYYYAVEAILSTTSVPARASATTPAAGGGGGGADVIAIDSGSTAAVGNFVADTDFNGGGTYAPGLTVTVPSGLAGAAPAAVYQSARQGAFSYTIPGLTTGNSYTVRLHFAELYFPSAGSRQFNVSINGTQVLTNFDIVAAAGGKNLTAVVETFPNIVAAGGQIVIAFSNGAKDQPMINGVEVLASNPAPAATSIDSGSTAAVGSFVADTDFNGGGTYAPGQTVTVPAGLANAAPAAVYQSARQGGFSYTIPGFAPNSTGHSVTLHFAELYFSTAAQRQFNVSINGTQVLTNFDIFAAAGNKNFTAVVQSFPNITANSSGQVVITFSNGATNQPMINGVVVQ